MKSRRWSDRMGEGGGGRKCIYAIYVYVLCISFMSGVCVSHKMNIILNK